MCLHAGRCRRSWDENPEPAPEGPRRVPRPLCLCFCSRLCASPGVASLRAAPKAGFLHSGEFQARARLAAVRQYFLGRKPVFGARNETVSTPGGGEGAGRRASPWEGPPGREPPQGPQAPGSQSLQTRFKFRSSILVLAAGLTL